jgi:hypothetical protein
MRPGRLLFAALGFFLLLQGHSNAMWAAMSERELIDGSEIIVIGEWQAGPGQPHIVVSEVLRGPPGLRSVPLADAASGLRSSNDLDRRTGDRGLWLLRRHPDTKAKPLYLADHPQRFVPAAGGEARIRQLRKLIEQE